MNEEKKRKYWRILRAAVIALCLLTFTPLVIPEGVYKPELFGVPYSLWTSFLITVTLVFLTYLGTKVHRGVDEEEVER
ncbi:MAG: hypothetical protein KAI99_20005 [Cyclobacteriaceae bacterium]|nr:hypothetical protein [Cyclobacteriaceae bacterium]MCK5470823.1 hypothetical protein [Cyclobacteriaceae bacterium]